MSGRFITIEGIEGAGKSSNMALVESLLRERGIDLVQTREPGGTPMGEALREILLDPHYTGMAPEAELLTMFAARAEHLHQVIRPALARGAWVLCDRFTDATYAYQGGGRGQSVEQIAALEQLVQGDFRPHLTLILDVNVATGLERAAGRSAPDRFEREQASFFDRVRAVYLARAQAEPERYRIINTARPLDEVHAELTAVMEAWLEQQDAHHDA